MKQYSFLLFDLDGTLSDPFTGIANCINYSLEHFGYTRLADQEIAPYIGPPLDQTFESILGPDRQHSLRDLVEKYRERYALTGYAENVLYDEIADTLSTLAGNSVLMGICTSKRADFAQKILDMFSLSSYFEFISGGDIGIEKWQQIESLREEGRIPEKTVMIGDRNVDLTAAHRNGLPSAAVLWGYGSRAELEAEHPKHILIRPSDLLQLSA